jgi:hypothetical protein
MLQSFLSALGVVLADVAADSMIVERSRLEPLGHKGAMQSMAYVFRFSGAFFSCMKTMSPLGKQKGWKQEEGFSMPQ